jgi:hypothetical protein
VGAGTIVLFIDLFLPWYSAHSSFVSVSWNGLSNGWMYITLILAIAVIALLGAEALGVWKLPATSPLGRDQVLLIATVVNLVLVVLAVVFKYPDVSGVGWSFGAFLGLAAAAVAAFPLAWPVIQARRGKS